ncbi:neurogenic locus notch homolog protein 3-like [Orbicella faveolata]|uniref:neurogenic locus notch homolog protein 3-like n=1 Tax=Orbicella faveolata TaxID=48498 RepID=UPI0009E2FDD6|nr:neurogenic locus notch homolog protein 3-like [Orbicella faveolata]
MLTRTDRMGVTTGLLLFPVLLVMGESFQEAATQQCPGGRTEYSTSWMMLQRHVFKTIHVSFGYECLQACHQEITCQSFNYVISQSACELNNRTKEARPEDFVPNTDRYYFRRDRNRVPLGSIPGLPAETCTEIKASEGGQAVSGKYWFDEYKTGKSVLTHCDMDTEGNVLKLICYVDECNAPSPVCHANATCQNLPGSYLCSCNAGFFGDGQTCTYDVNECASDPCLNGGSCIDRENRFSCSCLPGYQGSRCENDIDECATSSPVCHAIATCQNLPGSYLCSCKADFFGDGQNCICKSNWVDHSRGE